MTRRALLLLLIPTALMAVGVSAWAYWSGSAASSQLVASSTIVAPSSVNAVATTSTSITITVSAAPASPSATPSGYSVRIGNTTACSIASTTGNCTATGLAVGTSASFDVYSTLASWISATKTTVSATTLPASPSSTSLVNGGGTGNAYVNAANQTSVSVDVSLPSTSKSTEVIHLTAFDGSATVTATTQSATAGTGTLHFTGLNLGGLAQGTTTFTSWASNAGGSSVTSVATVTRDSLAPAAPTGLTLASGQDTGSSSIDGITNLSTPTFTGSAENNATIALFNIAATIGSGSTNGTGTLSAQVSPALSDNSYTVTAKATDAAGNTSAASSGKTITVDTVSPSVTVTSVNGATRTFPYSTSASITSFGGTCGAASGDLSTVTPLIAGAATGPATTTCSSGSWTLTLTSPLTTQASRTLTASQVDTAGNTGTASSQTVILDTTAPSMLSINRAAGATNPTKAGPLNWTVTFSEPVSGVAASNFVIVKSGTAGTAPTITSVTPTSSTPVSSWTVSSNATGTTGSNVGSIGLNLVNGAGVSDAAMNSLVTTTFTGQAFVYDTTAPTAAGVAVTASGTAGIVSAGDVITLTYSESLAPSSLLAGWDGSGTQIVTLTLTHGGASNDSLTFGSLAVGSLDLGAKDYATSASATASANVSLSGAILTVTLSGTPSGAVAGGGNNHKSTLVWSPSTAALDVAGNAVTSAGLTASNAGTF